MKTFEYKGEELNTESFVIYYTIGLLMRHETMSILKGLYKEGWTEKAEFLFNKQYDNMENFVKTPDISYFVDMIKYGKELEQELEMSDEDKQIFAYQSKEIYLKLDNERKEYINKLTSKLLEFD